MTRTPQMTGSFSPNKAQMDCGRIKNLITESTTSEQQQAALSDVERRRDLSRCGRRLVGGHEAAHEVVAYGVVVGEVHERGVPRVALDVVEMTADELRAILRVEGRRLELPDVGQLRRVDAAVGRSHEE